MSGAGVQIDGDRLMALLNALERMAAGENNAALPVSEARDALDALALGVNVLQGELRYASVSRQRVEGILDAMRDLVIVVDAGGRMVSVNQTVGLLLGFLPAGLKDKPLSLIVADDAASAALLQAAARGRSLTDVQISFHTAAGGILTLGVNAAPLRDGDAAAELVIVARDMRETFRLAEQAAEIESGRRHTVDLLRAKVAAETASHAKTAFLRNISHEIRTPIAAMIGIADVLAEKSQPGFTRDWLARIQSNGQALLALVEDILDITKIEAGKLEFAEGAFSPRDCVSEVLLNFAMQIEPLGIQLETAMSPHVPSTVGADCKRLQQVLRNVIGNAVKFTKAGKITVKVDYAGSRESGSLSIDVADTGIGIGPSAQANLFEPFAQAGDDISQKYGGTGLGLHLSRLLARGMGGDLVLVRSVPGAGSLFRMTISAPERAERPSADAAGMKPLSGMRILLADDNADVQMAYAEILRLEGANVVAVSSGIEAVASGAAGIFDIILLDVRMPGLDGTEAMLELRRRGCKVPIYALTADALKEHREKCLAAGFADYITKPVDYDQFVARVAKAKTEANSSIPKSN